MFSESGLHYLGDRQYIDTCTLILRQVQLEICSILEKEENQGPPDIHQYTIILIIGTACKGTPTSWTTANTPSA